MCRLLLISCYLISSLSFAQSDTVESTLDNKANIEGVVSSKNTALDNIKPLASPEQNIVSSSPEVGKHVMANMDAGNMILSLLMVLALIIICAFVLKRFNLTQQGVSQLKVVTSLSLGAKERVIVCSNGRATITLRCNRSANYPT